MRGLTIRILAGGATFIVGVSIASALIIRRVSHQGARVNNDSTSIIRAAPPTSTQTQPTSEEIPRIAPISYSKVASIRAIDFANFEYPGSTFDEYKKYYPEASFKLSDGKYGDWRYGVTLESVVYGDITGDGEEEAIINFREETEGSAAQNCVYIFTLENKTPKVLWTFESGDRAEGGLKKIAVERGNLILDLYGKETDLENNSGAEFSGMCCPKSFTRSRYQWRNGELRRVGALEVFPYSEKESRRNHNSGK